MNITEGLALNFKGPAGISILCKLLHNILGHVFKNSVLFLQGMTEIKTKQYRRFEIGFLNYRNKFFQWFLVLSMLQFAPQFL